MARLTHPTRNILPLLALFVLVPTHFSQTKGLETRDDAVTGPETKNNISKAAAESCAIKVDRLRTAGGSETGARQTTRFSENEINSYLAFELSSNYHPSLKNFEVTFEESKLQGIVKLDFDELGHESDSFLEKLVAKLFSGTHIISVRGNLIAKEGKGSFQLEQARFDDSTLPNILFEQIITAVGRKQTPPFDPMQPTTMPYGIKSVEVFTGHIQVHQ